jgi:WD40 repeat protein
VAAWQAEAAQAATLPDKAGYAAGNLLNLLCHLELDLTGYDFSGLAVWQAFLRDVDLHEVNFAGADIARSVFTETMPSIFSVVFSPDGSLMALGDYASNIHLWHVAERKKLFTFKGHTRPVWSLAFSPDNQLLASSSDDHTLKLWNIHTGHCLRTLAGHTGWVRTLAFSPDGQTIASGSYDQTVKLWDVPGGECRLTLTGHSGRQNAACLDAASMCRTPCEKPCPA